MKLSDFVAYATLPDGTVRRLEIPGASCQGDAVRIAFLLQPNATAISARQADRPVRDALLRLERRAS